MRDNSEAKTSVHTLVAFGALALLCRQKLLQLLRRGPAEHLWRDREHRKVALFSGLLIALLVLLRIRVVADDFIASVYEAGKLVQVLVYEVGVSPQFVNTPLTVPQRDQRAFRLVPPLVQLTQMHPQLLYMLAISGVILTYTLSEAIGLMWLG